MQSTAAIEPDSKNSNHPNLVACLALYQHRQDQAVGIHWVSKRARGLLWYYGQLHQAQLSRVMTAAYLNGIIQQGAAEIKTLVKEAETAENKQKILEQVRALEKTVKKAKQALDDIKKD